MTKTDADRTAKPCADEHFRECFRPVGSRAVGLSQTDPITFGVMNDSRLGDIGGEVRQRADDPPRLDGRRDDPSWIDAFETQAVELATVVLEVPPRDAILCADDERFWALERTKVRRQAHQAVSFHHKKNDIRGGDLRESGAELWLDLDVTIGADHSKAAHLH